MTRKSLIKSLMICAMLFPALSARAYDSHDANDVLGDEQVASDDSAAVSGDELADVTVDGLSQDEQGFQDSQDVDTFASSAFAFARCTFNPIREDRGVKCSASLTSCPPPKEGAPPSFCSASMTVKCRNKIIFRGKYNRTATGGRTVYQGEVSAAYTSAPSLVMQPISGLPSAMGAVLNYKLKNRTGSCFMKDIGQTPNPAPAPGPNPAPAPTNPAPAPAPAPAPTNPAPAPAPMPAPTNPAPAPANPAPAPAPAP